MRIIMVMGLIHTRGQVGLQRALRTRFRCAETLGGPIKRSVVYAYRTKELFHDSSERACN